MLSITLCICLLCSHLRVLGLVCWFAAVAAVLVHSWEVLGMLLGQECRHSWPCALQSFNISMRVSNVCFGPKWAKLNVAFNLRWAADLYKTHTRLPEVVVEPPVLEIFKNHLSKHVRNDKSWADPALGWEAGQMASRGPGPTAGGQRGISERNKTQKSDLCRSALAKKHAHC